MPQILYKILFNNIWGIRLPAGRQGLLYEVLNKYNKFGLMDCKPY